MKVNRYREMFVCELCSEVWSIETDYQDSIRQCESCGQWRRCHYIQFFCNYAFPEDDCGRLLFPSLAPSYG